MATGVLIFIAGPKPLIHYLYKSWKLMWWNSIFGNYLYKWLNQEVMKYGRLRKDAKELDEIYLQVIDTWNPNAPNIGLLYDAISKRSSSNKFIPLDLICKCIFQPHLDLHLG